MFLIQVSQHRPGLEVWQVSEGETGFKVLGAHIPLPFNETDFQWDVHSYVMSVLLQAPPATLQPAHV